MAPAAAIVLLGLVACRGGTKAPDPDAIIARPIGKLGATVDAPRGWELTAVAKDSYRLGDGPGKQVVVRDVAFPPASVDELYATECARAKQPGERAITPAGALFVACTLSATTKDGKSSELVHVATLIRIGARGIKCHFGIAGDAELATAVCRSLRR